MGVLLNIPEPLVLLDMLEPLDMASGREVQETTAMLLLPQLVNPSHKLNVLMYQERAVPQLSVKSQNKFAMMYPVKTALMFQEKNVPQYPVHLVSLPTSKYANQSQNKSANKFLVKYARMSQRKNVTPSQNNNVRPSKRKSVLPSQKLLASLNHAKNVFLFQTKLASPHQSKSVRNSQPRNVVMSHERSVNQPLE